MTYLNLSSLYIITCHLQGNKLFFSLEEWSCIISLYSYSCRPAWNACVCDTFISLPYSVVCCGSWSSVRPFAACLHGFGKAITFQTLISGFHLLQLACEIAFCCFNGRHLVRSLKSPPEGPICFFCVVTLCCVVSCYTRSNRQKLISSHFWGILTLLFEDGKLLLSSHIIYMNGILFIAYFKPWF